METIHQDLKQFQTALENQLVAIINEDYAEFLQLSSKLKGVDEAVSSVRAPILAVLKRVDEAQHAMTALRGKTHAQLQTADELQQQEKDLQLSIQISEKLLLLEELLEIESPADSDEDELETGAGGSCPVDSSEDSDDEFDNFERVKKSLNATSAAEGCAKLERAAQIFVQLDLEFLNGMHLATIQREEKRLAVVEETLLRRLETEFATEIFPDTFYNRDHAISSLTLSYLLRAYVLLHKSHVPEEMVGRLLVQPFAEENLTRGKLDGRVRGSCEGLPQIYESILDFIASKFAGTLALSVCQGESKCSVDILGNAIWKPLQEIISSKHGVIFQAADPERFHQSYTISMRFLADVEDRFCKTEIMKIRFRSHESVVEFKEKWNIDVYFQLRASQLASSLEKSFGVKRDEPTASDSTSVIDKTALIFENSKRLWQAMQDCWSDRIFLAPLLPNFCKLCVQLFTYYIEVWKEPLLNAVAVLNSGTKVDFAAVPLCFLSTEEDLLFAGSDFHVLYEKISQDLLPAIKSRVDDLTNDSLAFVTELFQETDARLLGKVGRSLRHDQKAPAAAGHRGGSLRRVFDLVVGAAELHSGQQLRFRHGEDAHAAAARPRGDSKAKAEFLNPGGSSKDRVAKGIVEDAERRGLLKEGGTIVEGTSGSTGISLSLMARARGYRCIIVMPDDQAKEKSQLLEQFGAEVVLVKPASIVNAKHYVNEAKRLARNTEGGYFTDQFENTANFDSHYATTGPEIWRQTNGTVDAFVMAAGWFVKCTGGTIAGTSAYLKEQNPDVQVFLADPPGSSLYNKVRSNVCYAPQQAETKVRRHSVADAARAQQLQIRHHRRGRRHRPPDGELHARQD
ncbi:hypothetical protein ON010_g14414 [Phytophthora cinnamomi]|nr:hypothetical protein ON010_g14414 [Phytophthora cinnamomi]